jgi:hypothetical protein
MLMSWEMEPAKWLVSLTLSLRGTDSPALAGLSPSGDSSALSWAMERADLEYNSCFASLETNCMMSEENTGEKSSTADYRQGELAWVNSSASNWKYWPLPCYFAPAEVDQPEAVEQPGRGQPVGTESSTRVKSAMMAT